MREIDKMVVVGLICGIIAILCMYILDELTSLRSITKSLITLLVARIIYNIIMRLLNGKNRFY